jgi:hypothetical protein
VPADLSDLIGRTNRVVVVRGDRYDVRQRPRNDALADVRGEDAVADLVAALAAESSDAAIMTPGTPTIAFLRDREALMTATLVGAAFIRCPARWEHDARIIDPQRLVAWFADRELRHAIDPA